MNPALIEDLINKSLKRLNDEYELINTTFLNILHQNIDVLINNSDHWFKSGVPGDFKKALNALLTLSFVYTEERRDGIKILIDQQWETIELVRMVTAIIGDVDSLFQTGGIRIINPDQEMPVRTMPKIFSEAIYNIFLSLLQFCNKSSTVSITFASQATNIQIDILFKNLLSSLPDIAKLSKSFFSYFDGINYHISIGLNVALDNLRNCGALVSVREQALDGGLLVSISFPSLGFLSTIDDIRAHNRPDVCSPDRSVRREVLISIDDLLVGMVVREILQDNCFIVKSIGVLTADHTAMDMTMTAIIVDYEAIRGTFGSAAQFVAAFERCGKILIIHGRDEQPDISGDQDRVVLLQKPFQLDRILDYIQ